jgi:hypothetical protein
MTEVHTGSKANGHSKPVVADPDYAEPFDDAEHDQDNGRDSRSGMHDPLHLKAMTPKKTVELPDLVERAQRQVQDHLRSAEQDAATYADRISLIDAEIEKSESDKTQAEDQVRYWQSVQESVVHVLDVLRQRRAGPQAALDALRKNGIH